MTGGTRPPVIGIVGGIGSGNTGSYAAALRLALRPHTSRPVQFG